MTLEGLARLKAKVMLPQASRWRSRFQKGKQPELCQVFWQQKVRCKTDYRNMCEAHEDCKKVQDNKLITPPQEEAKNPVDRAEQNALKYHV